MKIKIDKVFPFASYKRVQLEVIYVNRNSAEKLRLKCKLMKMDQLIVVFKRLCGDLSLLKSSINELKRKFFLLLMDFHYEYDLCHKIEGRIVMDFINNYDYFKFYSDEKVLAVVRYVRREYLKNKIVVKSSNSYSRAEITMVTVNFIRVYDSYKRCVKRHHNCIVRLNGIVLYLESERNAILNTKEES